MSITQSNNSARLKHLGLKQLLSFGVQQEPHEPAACGL